jgi:hypothetical protein
MRAPLLVTLALLASSGAGVASTAGYSDTSAGCPLVVAGQVEAPQPAVGCSATETGTATSASSDCNPAGCAITVEGSASGTGGTLGTAVRSVVLYTSSIATLCTASAASGTASCSGAVRALFVSVAPNACADFAVRTTASTAPPATNAVMLRATASHGFHICRDFLGNPTITSA